eukprot:312430-Chlamydomonas_euryale.AAC.2
MASTSGSTTCTTCAARSASCRRCARDVWKGGGGAADKTRKVQRAGSNVKCGNGEGVGVWGELLGSAVAGESCVRGWSCLGSA